MTIVLTLIDPVKIVGTLESASSGRNVQLWWLLEQMLMDLLDFGGSLGATGGLKGIEGLGPDGLTTGESEVWNENLE